MNDALRTIRPDNLLIGAIAVWAAFCVAMVAFHSVRNPMHQRAETLDARLASIVYVPETFESAKELDARALRDKIMAKQALWNDLIAPPPPPPTVEKPPNLDELVKGIRPSAREQISNAQGLRVKIRTEGNNAGAFYGVGDKIGGLTISEITAKEVLFTTTIKGKEYTISVKRT